MNNIKKEVSQLRNIFETSNIDENSKESKVLKNIIDIIEKMSEKINLLEERNADFIELFNSIDEYSEEEMQEENVNLSFLEQDNNSQNTGIWGYMECEFCGERNSISEEDLYNENSILCHNCNEIILSNIEENKN